MYTLNDISNLIGKTFHCYDRKGNKQRGTILISHLQCGTGYVILTWNQGKEKDETTKCGLIEQLNNKHFRID